MTGSGVGSALGMGPATRERILIEIDIAKEDDGRSEQMRQPGSRLGIDGDAEHRLSAPPRFLRCPPRVLDAEPPRAMVETFRLSVGDDEQQFSGVRPFAEA